MDRTSTNSTTMPESNKTVVPVDMCAVATTAPVKKKAHHIIKPTQNRTVVLQLLNGLTSAIHAAGSSNENKDDFTSSRYALIVVMRVRSSHRYIQVSLA